MGRGRRIASGVQTQTAALVRLWLLRILVPLNGQSKFISRHGFFNDSLATVVGLGHWVDPEEFDLPSFEEAGQEEGADFDPVHAKAVLRRLHQQAERNLKNAIVSEQLRSNIDKLVALVGLNEADCKILEFTIMVHNESLLDDAVDLFGHITSIKVFQILSVLLAVPEAGIRASLSGQGILAQSGLVELDRCGSSTLRGKLNLLSDAFGDLMLSSDADVLALLRGTVAAVPAGALALSDYGHIQGSLDVLLPYLKHAVDNRLAGVNVFLYGAPGTGKSQLARAISHAIGSQLLEVACENEDGDPIAGERRLRAFKAAQSFFAQRPALIVLDEAEDVFNDGDVMFGRQSTAQVRKAWVNRMLETNPVPTLWLSNSARGMDPAFIRRFDVVIELPIPPKKQRQLILQASCGDLLDAQRISVIAESSCLSPAVVAKASAVVRAIESSLDAPQRAAAFECLVSNTLQAQGHRPLALHDPSSLSQVYDPRFIQADADLAALAQGLRASKTGRLCLYGPPGTGKTAYGRWLAEQLGRPLFVKRVSDLIAPYVGQSEINIAEAFREAASEGAVLMVDEVDSFLQDRRGAQRSWEVSLVNEMLTQMEAFPGVFVASTNLMQGLDQAALRRFDLKVKFDYLQPEQAWALLLRYGAALGWDAPVEAVRAQLAPLRQLTPGDFAVVARQSQFRTLNGPSDWVTALAAECAAKEGGGRAMGFIA